MILLIDGIIFISDNNQQPTHFLIVVGLKIRYIMGIKKIARPINLCKNNFIKWLKDNKAEAIEEYEGEQSNEWDYYRHVSAFINENLYSVYFTIWKGNLKIDYSDEENRYNNMSIDDFNNLIW